MLFRYCLIATLAYLFSSNPVCAQKDTGAYKMDSLLSSKKGLLGDLAQALLTDTAEEKEQNLQRADRIFQRYDRRIIRNIKVQGLEFGVSIGDTTKRLNNWLTHLSNNLHRTTRGFVIRNHLFFRENDRLSPFLLANNERYLRDLSFLQDARIIVRPVKGYPDSVDVTVVVKDVLSIGGDIDIGGYQKAIIEIKEDNFSGFGDRIQFQTLVDQQRNKPFGFGAAYLKRNVLGSFIDATAGYLNFSPAFNSGQREESVSFIQLVKPLVNPLSKWTYAANFEIHSTSNMFNTDSVYEMDLKYKYNLKDAWVGWNPSYKIIGKQNEARRIRQLFALRILEKTFSEKPLLYKEQYNYAFADLFALLGSASLYRQNFFKADHIYGFGRREDLPQGVDGTVTAGYTKRDSAQRPYASFNGNLNYITSKKRFLNYSIGGASFFHKGRMEDISLIGTAEYFGRLHYWKNKWKQRLFMNATAARQWRGSMEEPLFLESQYGLPFYQNDYLPGHTRISLKAEWIFYAPQTLLFFKFAPFVSLTNTFYDSKTNGKRVIPVVGGGIRLRNESLIFGTIELRGNYFLEKDFSGKRWDFRLRTNLRYKYNQNFIRRPELVRLN